MKNKGFTLIELIIVIALVGLISSLAVVSYNGIMESSKEKVFTSYEEKMISATTLYLTDNLLPYNNRVLLSDLINNNEIDYFKNPTNDSNCIENSYIEVIINDDDYTYSPCLICPNYQSKTCNN